MEMERTGPGLDVVLCPSPGRKDSCTKYKAKCVSSRASQRAVRLLALGGGSLDRERFQVWQEQREREEREGRNGGVGVVIRLGGSRNRVGGSSLRGKKKKQQRLFRPDVWDGCMPVCMYDWESWLCMYSPSSFYTCCVSIDPLPRIPVFIISSLPPPRHSPSLPPPLPSPRLFFPC